jgi:hypothetical protein
MEPISTLPRMDIDEAGDRVSVGIDGFPYGANARNVSDVSIAGALPSRFFASGSGPKNCMGFRIAPRQNVAGAFHAAR